MHRMVVDYIGKIIGGVTVRFDQDHVIQLRILHRDIPIQLIMEGRCPLSGDILADDKRLPSRQVRFHFFLRQGKAMLIVHHDLFAFYNLRLQRLQPLLVTEAVISLPFLHQLSGIFHINACLHTLALHIRPVSPILVRPFVMRKPCLLHRTVNNLRRPFDKPLLIRIFNPQHKLPACMFGNQKFIQRRAQVPHMHLPCRAGRVSCPNFLHLISLLFP